MDELTALAGKEGVELPDEALDMVSGGCDEGGGGDSGDSGAGIYIRILPV